MKNCPECGAAVDGLVCPHCQYRDASAPLGRQGRPDHWLCVHEDRGQRCANAGSLTESTRGSERWYCAQHFPLFAGRGYGQHRSAPAGGFKTLTDVLKPAARDFEAEPEREAIRQESIDADRRRTENLEPAGR